MGVLFLFVLQVQTLYYSADHKLVDGGLVIEGHTEVFGGEEDHLQFVQVHGCLCLASTPTCSIGSSLSLCLTHT